jgi:hypothetical protein
MTGKPGHEVAETAVRLLDDAYMAWFAAECECGQWLRAWFEATGRTRAAVYCGYRAALDREEAAARDLKRLSELAQPCREHFELLVDECR